jgi:predicted phage terminase large subunit-like protein
MASTKNMDMMVEAKILAAKRDEDEACRKTYWKYVKRVHDGRWYPGKFHRYVCDAVQDFIERESDEAYEILVVQSPPQHGKSQMVTGTLPSWYLGKNPFHRVLEVSYNSDLAEIFGRDNRTKIQGYGGELFDIELAKNPAAAAEFRLTNNVGGMVSCGIMSGISGKSANLVIIDDPVKNRQEADSKTFRDRQYAEWQNSIKSRLQAKGKVIVIMTPWHDDDLSARIIATEKNVTVLRFPCECEEEDDLLGREIGDALCPEIGKDNRWLESFKAGYVTGDGMRAWNALYQCRPTGVEGNMILREDWRTIDELPEIPYVCISVDATFNDKKGSDKVAVHLWGKSDNKYICLAIDKRRMDFPTTIKAVMAMREKCKTILERYPEATYIEAKANGEAVISVLREKVDGIIPVTPTEGKEARVQSILPIHQAGQVYVWKECRGATDMIEECAAFPTGAHDDDVDAFSQALSKLRNITAKTKHPTTPISDFFNILNVEDDSPLGGEVTKDYLTGGW